MSTPEPTIEFAPYEKASPGVEMVRQRAAGEKPDEGSAGTEEPAGEPPRPEPAPSIIEFPTGEKAPSTLWTRFDLWANARESDPPELDHDIIALNRMQESLDALDDETRLLRLLVGVWDRSRASSWDEVMLIVRRISDREQPLPQSLADEVLRRTQRLPASSHPNGGGKSDSSPAAVQPIDDSRARLVREQATWLIALDGWLLGMVGGELEGYARGELARLRALRIDADDRGWPYADIEHDVLTDELARRAGEWSLLLRSAGKPEQQWLTGCLHCTLQRNLRWTQKTKLDVRPEAAPRRGLDEMLAPYRQAS